MKLSRRTVLHLVAGLTTLPLVSRIARAQAYPARAVRIVVGFAPGNGADLAARINGQWLSERLGQRFDIVNRPGAGANTAMETVAKAASDGYNLLLVSPEAAINATLYNKLNYDFRRDIACVGGIVRVPNVMATSPSVPAKTVAEFIAYAKANPGKVKMASAGIGSPAHVSGELFKMMAGIDMPHVAYRGAASMLVDLINGQVEVAFPDLRVSLGYIKADKLDALAVTTGTRSDVLPDIPTLAETIAGYEASTWWGVGAPRKTPAGIIELLNKEINAGLTDPKMKMRLAQLGGTPLPGSPGDFERLIIEETEKWGKVVRYAGLKPG